MKPNLSLMFEHWVPFPDPGAPRTKTTLGLAIFTFENRRLVLQIQVLVAAFSNEEVVVVVVSSSMQISGISH